MAENDIEKLPPTGESSAGNAVEQGGRLKAAGKAIGETVMSRLHSARHVGETALKAFREAPLEFDMRPPRKFRIDQI